ncbi:hypothetical protein [Veronia pacifica]|uniref:Uncharacterized protein n=1 Tax=Veronia pacifica TaxID=1080227 RepID=A0A1C3EJ91_9GAMM|nr:hypothetical protein [Veronia pacifica]ODA33307.1 hypothetical protein A8L45_10955 [Veronia pacifica]
MKIEELIRKDNYALSLWEERGLMPSPAHVIKHLEVVTVTFLKNLKEIDENTELDKPSKLTKVQELVDLLPWSDFDTEEKEFLADVIAPAIESMGYNPWSII